MKLSKTKKNILSLIGLGALTTTVVISILIVNNDKKNNQVQEKTKEDIELSTATLKGSNITDGWGGTIFQDSFKNLWIMGFNKKLQVLEASSQKKGYTGASWINNNDATSANKLLKNSNIINGQYGTIFQDSFQNLWSMGQSSRFQVLKVNSQKNDYANEGWTSDTSLFLTKNSNITNGQFGTIFQDSFKNLWTMGRRTNLQVLKANPQKNGYVEGWTSGSWYLTKKSNIINGEGGTIFQDSFKNLWSMASGSELQVLKANPQKNAYVESWTSGNLGLTKNSNITNGQYGTIFQDDFGNLWALGNGTKLQVLKANPQKDGYVEGWTSDNLGLTKNSNINNGSGGIIFQDEFKNLWIMGFNKKLQVLKANPQKDGYVEGWTSGNFGLTKNSNITNGQFGTIFQDSFKNLWAMGSKSKLQVLKANSQKNGYVEGWTSDNLGLTKNSNITNGQYGTIFQDEFKNLWAMGFGSKLQVLKANKNKDDYVYVDSWIDV